MWIYKIENVVTGKVYIGQTIKEDVTKRWREHIHLLNKNRHVNVYLQEDWNTYTSHSFQFTVLCGETSTERLDSEERRFILEYKSKQLCYNISEGGQSSRIVYFKMWAGVKSPTGEVYQSINNIEEFARTHGINADKLRQLSRGQRYSYKGWTTLVRDKRTGYRTPKGHKMSVESSLKKSKTYCGIISPDGTVFNNVIGLTNFCKQHQITSVGMMSELCSGKRKQYKGWTYNPSVTLEK